MTKKPAIMSPRSAISKLALVCLVTIVMPSVSALRVVDPAAHALSVLERRQTASTCGNPDLSRCEDPKLPDDFCCPTDSTCISLDSSSSALCCPRGADCSIIQPIACEVKFQDVSDRPDAAIKTTRLNDKLDTCGKGKCCPFGYTCKGDSRCELDRATSSTKSDSPSSSASRTLSTSSSTASPAGIDSTAPPGATPLCPRFPGAAVAVGFFPGMLAGAIMALLGVIFLGRRYTQDDRPHSKGSSWSSTQFSGPHKRTRSASGTIIGISEPIPTQNGARTDFLRKAPSAMLRNGADRAKSWFSTKSSPTFRNGDEKGFPLHSINHWKMPTPPVPSNIPRTSTLGRNIPVTPPSQIRPSAGSLPREPSTESIKIYSPPSMVRPPMPNNFTTPSSQQQPQHQHGSLKSSIMGKFSPKFSPFKGTELRARETGPTYPPTNNMSFESRGLGALDPPGTANTTTTGAALQSRPSFPIQQSDHPAHHNTKSNLTPTYDNPAPRTFNPPTIHLPSEKNRHLTHMTTFTEVLRDAGLEHADASASRPDMPTVPRGLDWKKGGSKSGRSRSKSKGGSDKGGSRTPGRKKGKEDGYE